MRTLLCCAIAACAAIGCSAPARGAKSAGALPQTLVEPYLKIHDELAVDAYDGVRQSAGEIATAASALGAPAAKIDTAALQLAAAGDLAQARDRFGVLSDAIVAYMKTSGDKAPEGVRTAFCPMAQRPWLQRGDTLSNPYYGTSMPTCGEFR
jgi:Cu(I)/Ag(I) efflux system membrane fusion protein